MKWPALTEILVQWRDIDGAGHVNNAKYFSYFEAARVDAYYRALGLDPSTAKLEDLDIILAQTCCDFRSQANMGETLVIATRVTKLGSTSFSLGYEVREKKSGRLVAEGSSVQVCFDYATQQKKPIPAHVRVALEGGLP